MDAGRMDERIRVLYRENAAPSCTESFKSALEERLRSVGQRRRARVPARALVTALALVVVLAALGMGAYEVVRHVTGDQPVVVITDDTMSPGGTSSTEQRQDSSAVTIGEAADQGWTTRQITKNDFNDEVPVAQGSLLAWRAYDGHDYEIMLCDLDTGVTTQLTDNDTDDWEPKVYGDHVAWMEGNSSGPWNLRLYDTATAVTEKVADGTVRYGQYQLKGDLLVWPHESDYIREVRVLHLSTGEVQTISGWAPLPGYVFAQTDGRFVLAAIEPQQGPMQLVLYDTTTGTQQQIDDDGIVNDWRYLDGRRLADGAVVWSAYDGHDEEIFLYDIASGTTTRLTDNDVSDTEPEIGHGYVLWSRTPSYESPGTESPDSAREVVLYDRSSRHERILGQGYGRLAEDGALALWSEYPQEAEHLWVYDITHNEAANLEPAGSGASWPDVVDGRVVWYSELTGAGMPTAEIMVAERAPDTTSQGGAPATTTPTSDGLTIVPDDELSPMAKSCLATLDERLRASGVPVLSVSTRVAWEGDAQCVRENTDAADELPVVVVRIPLAAVNDSDYLFTTQQIEHQTAVMVTAGTPIRILAIVTVDEDTKQERTFSMGRVSDSGVAPEWKEPARMEYADAEASAKSAAMEACSKAGVDLVSFGFTEDDFGRTLELNAALGVGDSGNPGTLVDALQSSLSGLNAKSGAKIATVIVRVEDSAGSPVARATLDFGTISAFWLAPQYRGQTDMKPGIFQ